MYVATKDFKSPRLGTVKKGQEVEHNKTWLEAGLIIETKPEPKKEIETKPHNQKKKTK